MFRFQAYVPGCCVPLLVLVVVSWRCGAVRSVSEPICRPAKITKTCGIWLQTVRHCLTVTGGPLCRQLNSTCVEEMSDKETDVQCSELKSSMCISGRLTYLVCKRKARKKDKGAKRRKRKPDECNNFTIPLLACNQWLWRRRECLISDGLQCSQVNKTCLEPALDSNTSCKYKYEKKMERLKSSRCIRVSCSQLTHYVACKSPQGNASFRQNGGCKKGKPEGVGSRYGRCQNSSNLFITQLNALKPLEDLDNISSQVDLLSRAGSNLSNVTACDSSLYCSAKAMRTSLRCVFRYKLRFRNKSRKRKQLKMRRLATSYAAMFSVMMAKNGLRRQGRKYCRRKTHYTTIDQERDREETTGTSKMVMESVLELMDSLPVSDEPFTVSTNLLAVSVICPLATQTNVTVRAWIAGDSNDTTLDYGNTNGSEDDSIRQQSASSKGKSVLSFHLPVLRHHPETLASGNVSCGDRVPMHFAVYRDARVFTDMANESHRLASSIVSAEFRDLPSPNLSARPARMYFKVQTGDVQGFTPRCAYWSNASGDWLTDGCRRITDISDDVIDDINDVYFGCECDHLTNFAVLLVRDVSATASTSLSLVTYIGCSVSTLCLLLSMVNILVFRTLRQRLFQKILVLISVAMMAVMILMMTGLRRVEGSSLASCRAVAVALHFCLLTMFAMMSVACAHLYAKIIQIFSRQHLATATWVVAAVAPVLVVGLTAGISRTEAYGSQELCWLNGNAVFYGTVIAPLLLMLVFNFTLFSAIMTRIAKRQRRESSRTTVHQYRHLLSSLIGLSSIVGLTWISGVVLQLYDHLAVQAVFVVLSSLQGVAIFAFYSLRSVRVRKAWSSSFNKSTTSRLTWLSKSSGLALKLATPSPAASRGRILPCRSQPPVARHTVRSFETAM